MLLVEGARSMLLTVLARKLAAVDPAHLCRLKQSCTWVAGHACTCMADVTLLQHMLKQKLHQGTAAQLHDCTHSFCVLPASRITDDV